MTELSADRGIRAAAIPRLWIFWAAFAASSIGTGLALPLLGYYLHTVLGHSSAVTGALLSLLALANLGSALSVARVIDRFGSRIVVVVGTVLQLGGYVLLAGRTTFVALPLVIIGAGNGVFNAALPGLMRGFGPAAERPRLFSVNYMIINLGLGVGALLGAWATHTHQASGYQLAFTLNGLSYAVLGLTVLLVTRAEAAGSSDSSSSRGIVGALGDRRLRLLLTAASIAMIAGFAQLETAAPLLLLNTLHAASWTVGAFVAVNTAVIVGAQLAITRVARRLTVQKLPLVMCALWAVAALIAAVCGLGGYGVVGMFLFAALFGLGECLFSPAFPVLLLDISPPSGRGAYSSAFSAAFTGSSTVGSAAAAFAAGYLSFTGYWVAMLVVILVLGLVCARLRAAMDATAGEVTE
ncbi:MFS transporter [Streptomyces sp. NPDC015125]|uniref:MFS transporter n=1 Tax=Streptomyces sp. NPDC015125 TaxID=3364938 RepID=UPI003702DDCD